MNQRKKRIRFFFIDKLNSSTEIPKNIPPPYNISWIEAEQFKKKFSHKIKKKFMQAFLFALSKIQIFEI